MSSNQQTPIKVKVQQRTPVKVRVLKPGETTTEVQVPIYVLDDGFF